MTSKSSAAAAFEAAHGAPSMKIGYYLLGATVGEGTFGKVKYGVHQQTGQKVAAKILSRQYIKHMDVVSKIRREIQNLKLLRHPHIVQLYQVISTPTHIFMIMEYVSGGELFDYIVDHGKLQEDQARLCIQEIISAISYCHRHMIVHRDLKPENLLFDQDMHIKICDFGLSRMMIDGEFLCTACGSPNYAAPEIVSFALYAGPEVDIWSCGVILYALLCGTLPFDDASIPRLLRKIKAGIFIIPEDLNKAAANLICQMLQVNPLSRATIKEITQHVWFQKDLPPHLFPKDIQQTSPFIDLDAVGQVCFKLGVTTKEVHNALLSGDSHDQLAIAYNLIVDSKRVPLPNISKINKLFAPFYRAAASTTSETACNILRRKREHQLAMANKLWVASTQQGQRKPNGKPIARATWHLGINTTSQPNDVMIMIYRALKALNFEWKSMTPYGLRVRRLNAKTGKFAKMSLQVYQKDARSCYLDFKSLPNEELEHDESGFMENPIPPTSPNVMEYFEMCSALIKELVNNNN